MSTPFPESFQLRIQKEIQINASVPVTFAALLEQIGPGQTMPHGPMPMKLEPWPGGRWYRDLGNNSGHLWGHVQVIKPPTLLEITGPMFMSYAVASHLQYRLAEHAGGTKLSLLHTAIGNFLPEHREGVNKGWEYIINQIRERAQSGK
jgi:hypothetical protein